MLANVCAACLRFSHVLGGVSCSSSGEMNKHFSDFCISNHSYASGKYMLASLDFGAVVYVDDGLFFSKKHMFLNRMYMYFMYPIYLDLVASKLFAGYLQRYTWIHI